MVSYLYMGRAQPSLFVLLIEILEFLSTGNKLLIAHPGWGQWGVEEGAPVWLLILAAIGYLVTIVSDSLQPHGL